ncbi:hypothetical protein [Rhodoflexus sp.]
MMVIIRLGLFSKVNRFQREMFAYVFASRERASFHPCSLVKHALEEQSLFTTDYDTYRIYLLAFSITPHLACQRRERLLLTAGILLCLYSRLPCLILC